MKNQPANFHLGVEWAGDQIRAGVFDGRWRLQGRASRSAKTQRGLGEVLKRIARCALDAVDEADCQPKDIVASAILTDGHGAGQVWGPQQVNQLAEHLAPEMSSNLLTAGRVPAIMWAVHEYELSGGPQSWLGLFSEPELAIFTADRAQPGKVQPIVATFSNASDDPTAAAEATGPLRELLAAVHVARPDLLLLIGPEYEDAESTGSKRIRALLSAASLKLPVHTPGYGRQVGVWAAAKLAARTFARQESPSRPLDLRPVGQALEGGG